MLFYEAVVTLQTSCDSVSCLSSKLKARGGVFFSCWGHPGTLTDLSNSAEMLRNSSHDRAQSVLTCLSTRCLLASD